MKNGITELSYTIEQEFGLAATQYIYHRGQQANDFMIQGDSKAIINSKIGFLGLDATTMSVTRGSGAVTLPAAVGTVLNTSTSIVVFYENGTPVTSPNFVNSFSLTLENNLRAQDAVAVLGPAGIGVGRVSVSGELNTYFGDEVLYNKVLQNTVSNFTLGFRDTAGNLGAVWDIPRLKYSAGNPDVTGINTDIFINLGFQAIRDPARDYTISLSRFEHLV